MKQTLFSLASLLAAFALIALLSGCMGADLSQLGVEEHDNAILCVRATIDPVWSESGAVYRRLEFPANTDLSTLNPETVAALMDECQ